MKQTIVQKTYNEKGKGVGVYLPIKAFEKLIDELETAEDTIASLKHRLDKNPKYILFEEFARREGVDLEALQTRRLSS